MTKPFSEVLAEMQSMHDEKSKGYGSADDPYANVKASAELGVPPWVGALLRLNDHLTRIKQHLTRGTLSLDDIRKNDLIDIPTYGAIALALFDEEHPALVDGRIQYWANIKQATDERYQRAMERLKDPDIAGVGFSENMQVVYGCDNNCADCNCIDNEGNDATVDPLGPDPALEWCQNTYYHNGADRRCELPAGHEGNHENWATAGVNGTPQLQWSGKPAPVQA